jgi:hypothetical protein
LCFPCAIFLIFWRTVCLQNQVQAPNTMTYKNRSSLTHTFTHTTSLFFSLWHTHSDRLFLSIPLTLSLSLPLSLKNTHTQVHTYTHFFFYIFSAYLSHIFSLFLPEKTLRPPRRNLGTLDSHAQVQAKCIWTHLTVRVSFSFVNRFGKNAFAKKRWCCLKQKMAWG